MLSYKHHKVRLHRRSDVLFEGYQCVNWVWLHTVPQTLILFTLHCKWRMWVAQRHPEKLLV